MPCFLSGSLKKFGLKPLKNFKKELDFGMVSGEIDLVEISDLYLTGDDIVVMGKAKGKVRLEIDSVPVGAGHN